MKVMLNRAVRRLFGAVSGLLLGLAIAGQVLAYQAADDYKQALIAHDAGLAGVLVEQGMDPAAAAAVFTAAKSAAQQEAGRQALARSGVTPALHYRFVPEAATLLRRYQAAALAGSLFFAAVLLAGLLVFFTRQDRRIERSAQAIEGFMRAQERGRQGGNHPALFALAEGSLEEGSLAQLFGAVSSLAASLTAHLQKEQHDREFLKETISDISHQLKTPLAALQMYAEIMQAEEPADPVIVEFIVKSQHELKRMEYLIQNLLKLARLDAGTITLEKRPLALPVFLDETLDGFAVRAEVEGKHIQVCCPAGLVLEGDPHWLAEALGNLVKNALDHTAAGGQIRVVCEETPLVLTIAVQDNGLGIHPEDLPHVFKRFYRSRFSQDHQGVGIGLTLARSIVEKHGGSIVVESEPEQGAVFRMIFSKLTNS